MPGFNQDYIVIQSIDPEISAASVGNVPASWQLYNNCVNGTDTVVAANTAAPFTNILRATDAATKNFAAYYQDRFIRNGNIPHRASAAIRAYRRGAGGFDGVSHLELIYGSRLLTDARPYPNGTTPSITITLYLVSDGTGYLKFQVNTASDGVVIVQGPNLTLDSDVFHRMGIEVLGRTVNFYFDPAAASDPLGLPGDSALQLVHTHILANSRGMEGPPVFLGASPIGMLSTGERSSYGEAILEELEGPEGNIQPGTGNNPGSAPPPSSSPNPGLIGWPKFPAFKMPTVSPDFGYWRMKAIRQLTFAMNNLRLGP